MPRPCSQANIENWVRSYFSFLDAYGAFILSAESVPADDHVRIAGSRMTMRVCFLLGVNLRARQRTPTDTPETLGLAIQSMLDRSWYQCRTRDLPTTEDDVVATIMALLAA